MAGTKEGGRKMTVTILALYGWDEDGKSLFHKRIGAEGGRKGHTGGFAANRELARIAGQKGGRTSRRRRSN